MGSARGLAVGQICRKCNRLPHHDADDEVLPVFIRIVVDNCMPMEFDAALAVQQNPV